jgi:hypothetical protein
MRFRPRDHERFIGSYDPEHEMPDPDRDPRDRWQSDAYRNNARDSRYAYRWNPDRIEGRGWNRAYRSEDEIQPRDRYEQAFRAGYEAGFDRGYEQGRYDWDRGWDELNRWRGRW